jgi:hypothetical protein
MNKRFYTALLLSTIIVSTIVFQIPSSKADIFYPQFGQSLSASINPAGDVDSFKFSALNGDPIYIRARSGFENGLNPQIRLYSSNGSLIQSNSFANPTGTTAVISCLLNEIGEYTVLVSDYEGQKTGDYGIIIYNFNNQQTVPSIQFYKTTSASLDLVGEVDCYKLSAIASNYFLISAAGNQGKTYFWLQLKLFHPNGSLVFETPINEDPKTDFSITLNETNTYILMVMCATQIKVAADISSLTGSYTLVTNLLSGPTLHPTSSSPTIFQSPNPNSTLLSSPSPKVLQPSNPTSTTFSSPSPSSNLSNENTSFQPWIVGISILAFSLVIIGILFFVLKQKKKHAPSNKPTESSNAETVPILEQNKPITPQISPLISEKKGKVGLPKNATIILLIIDVLFFIYLGWSNFVRYSISIGDPNFGSIGNISQLVADFVFDFVILGIPGFFLIKHLIKLKKKK